MTSGDPLPDSALGGASDAGAHGKHPASGIKIEGRSARPEDAPGDAAIERRRRQDINYDGPERRLGRSGDRRED